MTLVDTPSPVEPRRYAQLPTTNSDNSPDPPHPLTHYGKSKLMGETVVLKHKCELPVVILRPAVIYGQGNMFFDYLFGMLKAGFNPLWRGYSSLCYIDDVVCALKLCAESKKAESNIYFISDGGVYSWRQITDAICARIKPKKIDVPIPACVIRLAAQLIPPVARIIRKPYLGSKFIEFSYPYWLCDPEKIRNELEFKCGFDLKRGMDLWLDEYCRRGIPGNA